MKTLQHLTIIVLAGCLLSCEEINGVNDSAGMSDLQKYMETVSLDSILRAVHAPSMGGPPATEKQLQVFNKIATIHWMKLEFKDGEFVFMTENEFLSEGCPKSYYILMKREIDGYNNGTVLFKGVIFI
jgi:hypothetical protein